MVKNICINNLLLTNICSHEGLTIMCQYNGRFFVMQNIIYDVYQRFIKIFFDGCTLLKSLFDDFTCEGCQISHIITNSGIMI